MDKEENKLYIAYTGSIIVLFFIVILFGLGGAIIIQHIGGLKLSTTGAWIACIGFLIFTWSWASPNPIIGWGAIGIDVHPEDSSKVLCHKECKKYSLWKQPNRLKFMVALAVLFLGGFLDALGQTFEI
ncbi:MAG: hypothetical protein ACSNEK_02780 [Parachlamydiaceae bacterium]